MTEGLAEVAPVIYNSLAKCYAGTVVELEGMTGEKYGRIHIVGGGSNAEYFNQLTAEATGIPVYAGPTEATAMGNVAAQMITAGGLAGLEDARCCVFRSFSCGVVPDKYFFGQVNQYEEVQGKG